MTKRPVGCFHGVSPDSAGPAVRRPLFCTAAGSILAWQRPRCQHFPGPSGYNRRLKDGGRETFRFRVTVPASAEAGTYEVGAEGWFADRGRTVTEIHAARVRVEK